MKLIRNNNKYPKLRTYVTFKKKLRLENYLLISSSRYGKSIHTSLRTGTNDLEIDRGRRENLKVENRTCRFCEAKVTESELHFLIECKKYEDYRTELFNNIVIASNGKWNLVLVNKNDQFILLMNGTQDLYEHKIFSLLHTYLAKCFRLRVALEENDNSDDNKKW